MLVGLVPMISDERISYVIITSTGIFICAVCIRRVISVFRIDSIIDATHLTSICYSSYSC